MTNPVNKMPLYFIGHGNPMYAITDNVYRKKWIELSTDIEIPEFILCISAHWYTRGTWVCLADNPETIHDFGGFPDELYKVVYPAKGFRAKAEEISNNIQFAEIQKTEDWGLDHGAWSVLMNLFPKANIPVFQLSIDYTKPPEFHYQLGKELAYLRESGCMVIASGNIVHNIRMAKWEKDAKPYDWALEFENFAKSNIESGNSDNLVNYQKLGNTARLAHPANDHYLPLLYILGMVDKPDSITFFNQGIDMGSMSMLSVKLT
ncbi:MAG: 4,5-DOPA dioxygenase extradiol [Bacteroidales bacterium]